MFYCFIFAWFVFLVHCAIVIQGQCAVNSDIIIGSGPCTYDIDATAYFYTSSTFSTKVIPPLRVLSGDFVYMGVHLNYTSEPTEHLLLETCWATKRADSLVHNITDTIVDFPGCASRNWRNVITLSDNGQNSDVTIRFPIFFLLPAQREFYLHCSVGACDNCEQSGCDSLVRVPQTFTRTAGVVSIGPIQRTDFIENENLNNEAAQNTSGFLIAACVLSGIIFLVIILGVLYCLNTRRKENDFQKQTSLSPSAPVLINKKPITSLRYEDTTSSLPQASASFNGRVIENSFVESVAENHYEDAL